MNLRNLDALRGLLAMTVLLGHARMLLWMSWSQWQLGEHGTLARGLAAASGVLAFGHEMVLVFFALSGFFIHLRLAAGDQTKDEFSTTAFLWRRARRILPPYYAALALTAALDGLGLWLFPNFYHAQTSDAFLNGNIQGSGFTTPNVVTALLAQPTLLGKTLTGNGALWSIQREVFYYALYPIFIWLWLRRRWLAYSLGIGVGLVSCHVAIVGWFSPFLQYYVLWLGGAWLAESRATGRLSSRPGNERRWFGGALLIGGFGAAKLLVPHGSAVELLLLVAYSSGAVMLFEALPKGWIDSAPGRCAEWLGVRSYSIYLFHSPALVFLAAWVMQTEGKRASHGWYALGGAVLAFILGLAAFHLIEHRFLNQRANLLPQ